MEVMVFDMAQLEFHISRGGITPVVEVKAPVLDLLWTQAVPETSSLREMAFLALDGMLHKLEMPATSGRWCKVGLYNPVTQQVAISGVPDTTSYGDGESLEVPPYGMLACLGSELELHSGRVLPEMRGSARSTSLALAAHAA